MKSRKGEQPRSYFRTERVQQANGVWFFLTRESIQEGPFRTHKEVMRALERHSAVWHCSLFSNWEFDRINSLGLQTELVSKTSLTAANGQNYCGNGAKKAQGR
ncbi:MAG: DUF6316 family protein [Pseudomonadales bacterium]